MNTDNTPQLVKTVTNNDGGTAVASDCTLSATAVTPRPDRPELLRLGRLERVPQRVRRCGVLAESPNPGTGYRSTGIRSFSAGTITSPSKTWCRSVLR